MTDFSTPEGKALFEAEVRKRTEPPYLLSRDQAEMLVATLFFLEDRGNKMRAERE